MHSGNFKNAFVASIKMAEEKEKKKEDNNVVCM